jgi:hypothetical protein
MPVHVLHSAVHPAGVNKVSSAAGTYAIKITGGDLTSLTITQSSITGPYIEIYDPFLKCEECPLVTVSHSTFYDMVDWECPDDYCEITQENVRSSLLHMTGGAGMHGVLVLIARTHHSLNHCDRACRPSAALYVTVVHKHTQALPRLIQSIS